MLLEFAQHDFTLNELETKQSIIDAIKYKPDHISVFPHHLKNISQLTSIPLCSPIDFPIGLSDNKTRLLMAQFAIKNGARILDVTYPSYPITNRKYDKFREDIKNFNNLGIENNVDIRYILEYRKYSYELLYKLTQILLDFGICTIFLSTGYFLDNITDNILAAGLIMKKNPNINIILTGNIWTNSHVKNITNTNMNGVRVNTVRGLQLFRETVPK